MREFGIFLLFVIGLLLGGIIGYAYGTDDMQEEAVVNGHAAYSVIDLSKTWQDTAGGTHSKTKAEFRWLKPGE